MGAHALARPIARMGELASYEDVVGEVRAELVEQVDRAVLAGVDPALLVLDPGLGFAKTAAHNWQLLRKLDVFAGARVPGAGRGLAQAVPRRAAGRRRRRTPPARTAARYATAAVTALVANGRGVGRPGARGRGVAGRGGGGRGVALGHVAGAGPTADRARDRRPHRAARAAGARPPRRVRPRAPRRPGLRPRRLVLDRPRPGRRERRPGRHRGLRRARRGRGRRRRRAAAPPDRGGRRRRRGRGARRPAGAGRRGGPAQAAGADRAPFDDVAVRVTRSRTRPPRPAAASSRHDPRAELPRKFVSASPSLRQRESVASSARVLCSSGRMWGSRDPRGAVPGLQPRRPRGPPARGRRRARGRPRAASPVYATAPWGGVEQDDFLNPVVVVDDPDTDAWGWLAAARRWRAPGRVREVRWGPRTLDVDVVTVDGVVSDDPELLLPHPGTPSARPCCGRGSTSSRTPWWPATAGSRSCSRRCAPDAEAGMRRRDDLTLVP